MDPAVLKEIGAALWHRLLRPPGGQCPSLADYVRGPEGGEPPLQRVNLAYAPDDGGAQVAGGRTRVDESSTSSTIRSTKRDHKRRPAYPGTRCWATAGPRQGGGGGSLGRSHP